MKRIRDTSGTSTGLGLPGALLGDIALAASAACEPRRRRVRRSILAHGARHDARAVGAEAARILLELAQRKPRGAAMSAPVIEDRAIDAKARVPLDHAKAPLKHYAGATARPPRQPDERGAVGLVVELACSGGERLAFWPDPGNDKQALVRRLPPLSHAVPSEKEAA